MMQPRITVRVDSDDDFASRIPVPVSQHLPHAVEAAERVLGDESGDMKEIATSTLRSTVGHRELAAQ